MLLNYHFSPLCSHLCIVIVTRNIISRRFKELTLIFTVFTLHRLMTYSKRFMILNCTSKRLLRTQSNIIIELIKKSKQSSQKRSGSRQITLKFGMRAWY